MRLHAIKRLFLCGLAVALASSLQGQGRAPVPVPAYALIQAPHIFLRVVAAQPGMYVVWNASVEDGQAVFAQRFDGSGLPQWPTVGVRGSAALSAPGAWEACADGQDGLWIVAASSTAFGLRRLDAGGKTVGDYRLPVSSAAAVTGVAGVEDGAGGLYLAWAQREKNTSTVWVQRFGINGAPQWPMTGVPAGPADSVQTAPNVVRDGDAGLFVAWKSAAQDLTRVRAQRFAPDGHRAWEDRGVGVQMSAGSLRHRIPMAQAGPGGLVVAWTQGVQGKSRLYFQRIDPDGRRTWPGEGETALPPVNEQWQPALVPDGQGNVWIGWDEVSGSGASRVMVVRRGPPKGRRWAPGELPLAGADGNQGRLTLRADGGSGLYAAWIDNRAGVGLYLQHVDAQGRLRYPDGREIAQGLERPEAPHVELAGPGRVAVVWLEKQGDALWALKERVVEDAP